MNDFAGEANQFPNMRQDIHSTISLKFGDHQTR